jgi:hypothetical protein
MADKFVKNCLNCLNILDDKILEPLILSEVDLDKEDKETKELNQLYNNTHQIELMEVLTPYFEFFKINNTNIEDLVPGSYSQGAADKIFDKIKKYKDKFNAYTFTKKNSDIIFTEESNNYLNFLQNKISECWQTPIKFEFKKVKIF